MKKHDYAAVRAGMEKGVFNHADADTIIHALRFAKKMCGDPSAWMYSEGNKANAGPVITRPKYIFIAMRDAALTELGE